MAALLAATAGCATASAPAEEETTSKTAKTETTQDTDSMNPSPEWVSKLEEGKNYTQCIQFLTDFHSPVDEEDLAETAWEPDEEYKDYQWTLARTDGGEWELLNWGY